MPPSPDDSRTLVLASSSPRRRELLALLGLSFDVVAPRCEEVVPNDARAAEIVQELSAQKASDVSRRLPDALVLGGDTVIEFQGSILGKPRDLADARAMLWQLRGHRHSVHTGIALIRESSRTRTRLVETANVWMRNFSDEELARYLDTEESLGKAGAYSIQGAGAALIDRIDGDYPTIVGLPLLRVAKLLESHGFAEAASVDTVYRTTPYANWQRFSPML